MSDETKHPLDIHLENFMGDEMRWSDDADDYNKTLVLGNLRSFVGYLKAQEPVSNVVVKVRQEEWDALERRNTFLFDTFKRVNQVKREYRKQRDSARELNQSSAHYIAAIQEQIAQFRTDGQIESAPAIVGRIVRQLGVTLEFMQQVAPVMDAVSILVVAARHGDKNAATRAIEQMRTAYNSYERYCHTVKKD